jgi:hypothetical protein
MIAGLSLVQKLIGGAGGMLLLALALLAAAKAGEARYWHKVADRDAARLAAAGAALDAQNQAVAAWKAEADARAKAAAAALQRARRQGDGLRAQADRIEAPRTVSGRCATPADVKEIRL